VHGQIELLDELTLAPRQLCNKPSMKLSVLGLVVGALTLALKSDCIYQRRFVRLQCDASCCTKLCCRRLAVCPTRCHFSPLFFVGYHFDESRLLHVEIAPASIKLFFEIATR
jgi:hypothetical protein